MRISKAISPLFIIVYLVIFHFLLLYLCIKWYHNFVVESFDPGVIILFAMSTCGVVLFDYCIFSSQVLLRQMLYFQGSPEGLCIYGKFHHKTLLRWNDIAFYGTICDLPGCMVLFFSDNTTELPNHKDYARITPNNIVIQFRSDTWTEIQKWLPNDIKKDIEKAISNGHSSFFPRKSSI